LAIEIRSSRPHQVADNFWSARSPLRRHLCGTHQRINRTRKLVRETAAQSLPPPTHLAVSSASLRTPAQYYNVFAVAE
jgi:hypothetical protein